MWVQEIAVFLIAGKDITQSKLVSYARNRLKGQTDRTRRRRTLYFVGKKREEGKENS